MDEEELKNIMDKDEKTWFTLSKLSEKTKLKESDIQKMVTKSKKFVQSSSLTSEGENMFSTRDDFQKKGSVINKILGAFKNRID